MRTPKTLKALLLSALLATAALGATASAGQAYFSNESGQSGVVDVYVDGQLVFDNVFPNMPMMFPQDLAAGTHQVVVTPFYLTPGQGDVLDTSVIIPDDGTYTLTLAESEDELSRPVLGIGVSGGNTQISE